MYEVFNKINEKFGYTDANYNMDYRLFMAPLAGYGLTANEKKTVIKYQLLGDKKTLKKNSIELYKEYKKIVFDYSYKDFYENVTQKPYNYGRDYDPKQIEEIV
jgi:hypothetical protein